MHPHHGGVLVLLAGVANKAPHGFRLLSEKPSLHGLYKGKNNASNAACPSRYRVDLKPNRVVPPPPAEPQHAHALLALTHVQ